MIKMPPIPAPTQGADEEPTPMEYRMRLFKDSSNVPDLHCDTRVISAPAWATKVEELRTALKQDAAVVCICGPRGTGKTQAAVEIMRDLFRRNLCPLYRTALEFIFKLRSSFGGELSEEIVMRQHIAPYLLVLDELQVRNDTDFTADRITYIVDARYRAKKRTLLISNLMPRKLVGAGAPCLEDNVGASVASRIQDFGRVIMFDGPSFRDPSTKGVLARGA